jgi:hypothetical protein
VLVRSIYRTIKLAEGWKWKAIKTQVYFNLFFGMWIVLVMVTLNSSNPTQGKNRPSSAQKIGACAQPI